MTRPCFFCLLTWALLNSAGPTCLPIPKSRCHYLRPAIFMVKAERKDSRWSTQLFQLRSGETALIFTHISLAKAQDRELTTGDKPTCHSTMLQWYPPSIQSSFSHHRSSSYLLHFPTASSSRIVCATIYNTLWVFWSYHGKLRCPSSKYSSYWTFLGTLGKFVLFKLRWIVWQPIDLLWLV